MEKLFIPGEENNFKNVLENNKQGVIKDETDNSTNIVDAGYTQKDVLIDIKCETTDVIKNEILENAQKLAFNLQYKTPGIYKKLSENHRTSNATNTNMLKNVLSELEPSGNIVKQIQFDDAFMLNTKNFKAEIPKMLPKHNKDLIKTDKELSTGNMKSDALNRLAHDVCKLAVQDTVVINRKQNEVISINQESKNTTIYKLLEPEYFGLELINNVRELNDSPNNSNNFNIRINSSLKPLSSTRKHLQKVEKRKNKIRKHSNSSKKDIYTNPTKVVVVQRTRSGRIVKTNLTKQTSIAELKSDKQEFDNMSNVLNNLKDSDYRVPKFLDLSPKKLPDAKNIQPISSKLVSKDTNNSFVKKRNFPLEAICRTCNKVFLGRRLRRHFVQHPDHMKSNEVKKNIPENLNLTQSSSTLNEDLSIFHFLMAKMQKSQHLSEDQRADLLLTELNDFVEQLHKRAARLIRNTSGLHFVNTRTARVLGIPEGHYALDLSAFEVPIETVEVTNISTDSNPTQLTNGANSAVLNNRSLDYTNLSITIDETLTDEAAQKLNLSVGGKLLPPSEESLLRGVNDLVHTDINKIRPTNSASANRDASKLMTTKTMPIESNTTSVIGNLLPPQLDHASDNAVEAVSMKETPIVAPTPSTLSLDLSVDFFEFNN